MKRHRVRDVSTGVRVRWRRVTAVVVLTAVIGLIAAWPAVRVVVGWDAGTANAKSLVEKARWLKALADGRQLEGMHMEEIRAVLGEPDGTSTTVDGVVWRYGPYGFLNDGSWSRVPGQLYVTFSRGDSRALFSTYGAE